MTRRDFRTPSSLPEETQNRCVVIPDDQDWTGLMNAAILMLTEGWRYEQVEDSDLTAEETAAKWYEIYEQYLLLDCATEPDDLSPYWDDADADDATGTPDVSTYTWSEQIEDWAIAAFIAASGVPGAAATYLTIAPRFRLLFARRDWGGIAKIFLDGNLIGEVDTYSPTPDVVAFDVVAE